ncbi:MAG: UDP-N-acetylmuramoyl-L-alanine--D-glutamate ligase [Sphingorhabdus sp.]
MITSSAFANKKYALLGLARSGLSSVRSLAASGAELVAWDSRSEACDAVSDLVTIADPMTVDLAGFDGIVVSPGVPLNRHPIAQVAEKAGVPIIGDIELFAQARQTLPAHRVVGITGTNGKSTTTALVHHMLKSAALPVRIGGNIGLPILSQGPLSPGGVYILELSSYQIDLTHSLACDVAALINLSPDHLSRYDGYQGYKSSKARLFAMQGAKQHSIFGNGDADTLAIANEAKKYRNDGAFHIADPAVISGQNEWPSLQGPHNLQNAAVAIAIAESLGLTETQWRAAFRSFKGLEHRMEIVAEAGGVLFVNDSKATNPASTAPALAAYPRIHWIVGGQPKGEDLFECEENFGNVVKAYTIGEAGPAYAKLLSGNMQVENCEMLVTAVAQAMAQAQPGEVIMLSPACASFDQFKDFEARGDCFKAAVHNLVGGKAA